jgi:hypothetical protein
VVSTTVQRAKKEEEKEEEEVEEEGERNTVTGSCDWGEVGARLKTIADNFNGDRLGRPRRRGGRPGDGLSVPLQLVSRLAMIIVVKKFTDMLQ